MSRCVCRQNTRSRAKRIAIISNTRGGIIITLRARKTQSGRGVGPRCAFRARVGPARSECHAHCGFFQLVSRDSFFHFFAEGAAGGAGVRVSVGEEGEEGGAVMDEDGQVGFGSDDGDLASH
jgi:hypothetical protein